MERRRLENLAAKLNSTFLKTKNVTAQSSQNENLPISLPYRSWDGQIKSGKITTASHSTSRSNLTAVGTWVSKKKHKLTIEERLNVLEKTVSELKKVVLENNAKSIELEGILVNIQDDLDMTKKAYIELVYFEMSKSNVSLKEKELAKYGEGSLELISNVATDTASPTVTTVTDITSEEKIKEVADEVNIQQLDNNGQLNSFADGGAIKDSKKKKRKKSIPSKSLSTNLTGSESVILNDGLHESVQPSSVAKPEYRKSSKQKKNRQVLHQRDFTWWKLKRKTIKTYKKINYKKPINI